MARKFWENILQILNKFLVEFFWKFSDGIPGKFCTTNIFIKIVSIIFKKFCKSLRKLKNY